MEASIEFDASPTLSLRQAYEAMVTYLELYAEEIQSEDIGLLLGEMQFSSDGQTVDPAAWFDWVKAVNKVLSGSSTA